MAGEGKGHQGDEHGDQRGEQLFDVQKFLEQFTDMRQLVQYLRAHRGEIGENDLRRLNYELHLRGPAASRAHEAVTNMIRDPSGGRRGRKSEGCSGGCDGCVDPNCDPIMKRAY
jgi:hypothetical protein